VSPALARCRMLVLLWALLPSIAAASEAPIAFVTTAGETWTFQRQIEVSVRPGACDAVALTSPVSSTIAPVRHDHAHARMLFGAGDNGIQAQCLTDGHPRGDPITQHWQLRARDMPVARARLRLTEMNILLDAGTSERAPARGAPITTYEWRLRAGGGRGPLPGLPARGERVALAKPTIDGEYFVTLRITDAVGSSDESTLMFRIRHGQAEPFDPLHEHAAWIDRAVVYGVAPDCFGKRGLVDVTARLKAIRALGITTLWLTPITDAPPGDFGYAVTDQFHVREAFGTEAELHDLITQAHAEGLHVILDLVVNHLSDQHPYFADAAREGRTSPYFGFFERTPAGAPVHYFDWTNLENLNFDSADVQRMIIEASARWVRDFDVDGFRVDAAWGPRQRAPDFWPRWSAELKRIKPDLLLLAEASARDGYYSENGFDAAYDWTDKLGHWSWQDAFTDELHIAEQLRTMLRDTSARSPTVAIFHFLNNNDTGKRFITQHGEAQTRVAAAMLLTLPGLPGLYCGDEVGAAFEPYRRHGPIVWDDAHGLRDWYTRLIALRAQVPALRSAQLRVLDTGASDQILAYVRPSMESGAERDGDVLVLLNFGAAEESVPLPADMLREGWRARSIDLLTGAPAAASRDDRTIILPPYGVRILQRTGQSRALE
jgi:cyclomaltodextrinase / maltogenic alpha-amylase / neopullulanase